MPGPHKPLRVLRQPPVVVTMPHMDNTKATYEAPTLEVVGTLHEITKGGALPNSDDGVNANNAFPNPTS